MRGFVGFVDRASGLAAGAALIGTTAKRATWKTWVSCILGSMRLLISFRLRYGLVNNVWLWWIEWWGWTSLNIERMSIFYISASIIVFKAHNVLQDRGRCRLDTFFGPFTSSLLDLRRFFSHIFATCVIKKSSVDIFFRTEHLIIIWSCGFTSFAVFSTKYFLHEQIDQQSTTSETSNRLQLAQSVQKSFKGFNCRNQKSSRKIAHFWTHLSVGLAMYSMCRNLPWDCSEQLISLITHEARINRENIKYSMSASTKNEAKTNSPRFANHFLVFDDSFFERMLSHWRHLKLPNIHRSSSAVLQNLTCFLLEADIKLKRKNLSPLNECRVHSLLQFLNLIIIPASKRATNISLHTLICR